MTLRRIGFALLFAAFGAAPAWAVLPHERLADPALEARARALSLELRCQVCQNQSIDDSNAPLAADLRRIVRERLSAGDSDPAVLDFVVRRYGDYVLLRPPVREDTYALWYGPFAVLILGAVGAAVYLRRRRPDAQAAAPALSEAEEKRLRALLERRE
ncbi:MAG: cytochrome c-type biogenesis protein CcmH [Tagaea sp.]